MFAKNLNSSKEVKVFFADTGALQYYNAEDLARLTERLEAKGFQEEVDFLEVPFVEKASFSKSWTGGHQVKVFLHRPLMSFLNQGIYKLVNDRGEVFSEVPQYKIPDLPVLRGANFLTQKNRKRAVDVFSALPSAGVFSKEALSEVLLKDDLVFIFSGVNGKVYMDSKTVHKAVSRLGKVVKYLRFHGMEAQSLDARFRDRVVVSLKKNKSS